MPPKASPPPPPGPCDAPPASRGPPSPPWLAPPGLTLAPFGGRPNRKPATRLRDAICPNSTELGGRAAMVGAGSAAFSWTGTSSSMRVAVVAASHAGPGMRTVSGKTLKSLMLRRNP